MTTASQVKVAKPPEPGHVEDKATPSARCAGSPQQVGPGQVGKHVRPYLIRQATDIRGCRFDESIKRLFNQEK